jgi:hypothetical protein
MSKPDQESAEESEPGQVRELGQESVRELGQESVRESDLELDQAEELAFGAVQELGRPYKILLNDLPTVEVGSVTDIYLMKKLPDQSVLILPL